MSNGRVEGRRGGRSMSVPLPRPLATPMQRLTAASTVSSPTLLIISLSSPKSTLSRLSLLIRFGTGIRPMHMYPLRICRCATHHCPVRNCDFLFSLQLFSPPPSCFVFGDGFCDMHTFFTKGYREPGPAEKNLVGKPSFLGQSMRS